MEKKWVISGILMKKLAAVLLAFFIVAVGMPLGIAKAADTDADAQGIRIIKDRLIEFFLSDATFKIATGNSEHVDISQAMNYTSMMNPDGSYSDVDYQDHTSSYAGALWKPYKALYRMISMAAAYNQPGNEAYHNPGIADAVAKSLRYWKSVRPAGDNWWDNEIGLAIAMGRIGIFMEGAISRDDLQIAIDFNAGIMDSGGANGAWRTQDYLYKKLIDSSDPNQYANIRAGLQGMVNTLKKDTVGNLGEAVQVDNSFWAHGNILYSEGYGIVLFSTVANWLGYTRETNFAPSAAVLNNIADYILDGTRWMIRGEYGFLYLGYIPIPLSVGGNFTSYAAQYMDAYKTMILVDPANASKYQKLLDSIMNVDPTNADNGLVGHKHFWRSDYTSHMRPSYGIMTKMASTRVTGEEYRSTYRPEIGSEVYWASAGVTAIFVNGREYDDIVPAFDWNHYPGTTAPYELTPFSTRAAPNDASFVGGVSNGMYGASVYTMNKRNTQAQKGYFYFDDEMIALGAGITSTRPGVNVFTTLNQGAAKDNAAVDGVSVPAGSDGVSYSNPKWAYNDQIGYVFPTAGDIKVSNKNQTGNYVGSPSVTKPVFTLYMDHGQQPVDASYQYIVVPGKTAAQVDAYSKNIPVTIVSNTKAIQAVRHDGLKMTQIIFYQKGTLEYKPGYHITVNQPCLVLIDDRGSIPVVTVSNPDVPGMVVDVKLTKPAETYYGRYKLEDAPYLGRSITQMLDTTRLGDGNIDASSFMPEYPPVNMIDNDPDSEWRSNAATGDYQWMTYDLGARVLVSKINLVFGPSDYAKQYIVQYSNNGTDWTDLQMVKDGDGSPFLSTPYSSMRYVRILLLKSESGNGYAIKALNVESTKNLALNKTASAKTSLSGFDPGKAVDGIRSVTSAWHGAAVGSRSGTVINNASSDWWQVDLGQSSTVKSLRIFWEIVYFSEYKIQTSNDGVTWTEIYHKTGNNGGINLIELSDAVSARYVRVQGILLGDYAYGGAIQEFEVYGSTGVTAPTPNYGAGMTNLAFFKPFTVDSSWVGGGGGIKFNTPWTSTLATDGDENSLAASARNTAGWGYVDLGERKDFNRIKIDWNYSTTSFTLAWSNDAVTWTDFKTVARPITNFNNGVQTDDTVFDTINARYIRVKSNVISQYGIQTREFEVYNAYSAAFTSAKNMTLNKGDTATLSVNLLPYKGDNPPIVTSFNTNAVTVDSPTYLPDGTATVQIHAVGGGKATLMLSHANADQYDLAYVVVNVYKQDLLNEVNAAEALVQSEYTSESWNRANLDSLMIDATMIYDNASATQSQVDNITARLSDAMSSLVKVPKLASVSASLAKSIFAPGQSAALTVHAQGEDGKPIDMSLVGVIYGSDNPAVAAVDSAGIVTAVGEGQTDLLVRASLNGIVKEALVPVIVDGTPPVTTAAAAPAGLNGWNNSDVTVTLQAVDALTPVTDTQVRLDNAAEWTKYDAAGVAITGEGEHTLQFYSIDEAGNREAEKTIALRIDRTAPTFRLLADGIEAAPDGPVTDSAVLTLNANDALSGLANASFTVTGAVYGVSPDGKSVALAGLPGLRNVDVTAVDIAGNVLQTTVPINVMTNVASMQKLLDGYAASGDVNGQAAEPFSQSLRQVQQQLDKGKQAQAAKKMQDFVDLLNSAGFREKFSARAAEALNADARYLLAQWPQPTRNDDNAGGGS